MTASFELVAEVSLNHRYDYNIGWVWTAEKWYPGQSEWSNHVLRMTINSESVVEE